MSRRKSKQNLITFQFTRPLYLLSGLLAVLCATYIYFIGATVVHVVVREELRQDARALSSKISELEAEYIKAQHALSEEIATQRGFSKATEKIFLDRTPASLALFSDNRP